MAMASAGPSDARTQRLWRGRAPRRSEDEAARSVPAAASGMCRGGERVPRGLIEMSTGFCAHPRAAVRLSAQNGKSHETEPKVAAAACRGRGHGKRHRRGRR